MQTNAQVDMLQKRNDTLQLILVSTVLIGLSFIVSSLVPYAIVFVLGVMCGRTGFSIFITFTAQGASKLIRQITGAQPLPTIVNGSLQDGAMLPISEPTADANSMVRSTKKRTRRRSRDMTSSDEEEVIDTRDLQKRHSTRRSNSLQLASLAEPLVRGFGQMVIDEWTKGS